MRQVVLERDMNACQAGIEGCTHHATDVHELKSRARGGDWLIDETNMISLCRMCHSYITQNPEFAELYGFSLPSWAGEAEYRAAYRARSRFLMGEDFYEVDDEDEES